ncbi:hypothetical protein [Culicoidibacter larvae]|uniref:Uncharacterized protein n=1 Tax=Culicoidibacter larvae TaxID=2579976 RepID=A0A5R8Q9G2_9FIRM|nr:hypothetical protein [Culicoidibacter larvae]TLG72067.1 hypothetical protein FEZ08_09550 [Culicoidibacter larvae]
MMGVQFEKGKDIGIIIGLCLALEAVADANDETTFEQVVGTTNLRLIEVKQYAETSYELLVEKLGYDRLMRLFGETTGDPNA